MYMYVLQIMQAQHASNNASATLTLGCLNSQATEKNLIKFMLHLYHEVQSTFNVLGNKSFFY